MYEFIYTFAMLLVGHAVADFGLQNQYVAMNKGSNELVMHAHCVMHAGAVLLITGSLVLAAVEWLLHGLIDTAKCNGLISYRIDQGAHVACKMLYVAALVIIGDIP